MICIYEITAKFQYFSGLYYVFKVLTHSVICFIIAHCVAVLQQELHPPSGPSHEQDAL